MEDEVKPLKEPKNIPISTSPHIFDILSRRITCISWIKRYNKEIAVADFIAGVTLGLTIIPQSIAYSALAGLPSEYGLYAALIGSLVYVIFGSIPQVSVGPTSLMAILTLQYTKGLPHEFAIILAFLAGTIELIMGLLNLGFLVNFISVPVTSSFTTATSVIIIGAQLPSLFGIKKSGGIFKAWSTLNAAHVGDSVLGLTCLLILLLLRKLPTIRLDTTSKKSKYLKKALWYVSISRNALVVFFSTVMTSLLISKYSKTEFPYYLSNSMESSSLAFRVPMFSISNGDIYYNFWEICHTLGSGIIVLPLVAVLANVAIAKAFVTDGSLDASQEMLTLGICNIAGSFFSAMPACGAFTRSAVSQASGVKTPLSGIYVGAMTMLAISVLTPYFQYIPKSALAAVLISAVLFMMDFKIVLKLWKCNKKDFCCWIICFLICIVFGVETGLLAGVSIDIFCILLNLGSPKIQTEIIIEDGVKFIRIKASSFMFYSGLDNMHSELRRVIKYHNYSLPVVIDCDFFINFDYTCKLFIHSLADELNKTNMYLILKRPNKSIEVCFAKHTHILIKTSDVTINELLVQS